MERFQIPGTPTCRVVYPKGLFTKLTPKGGQGEPKYNCIILVPKDDKEKCDRLKAEYDLAFKELQGKGFKGKTPDAINVKNNALRDGDKWAEEEDGKDAFRGYYVLRVASKNYRPIVTDMQKRAILNGYMLPNVDVESISDEELCDGDYIFCNVSFWTYVNPTAQGIGMNVHAVVRAKPGEQIGGASQNVDDYIDVSGYE